MSNDDTRWELSILFGPCSADEALEFNDKVVDAFGDTLGAVYGLGHWDEDEDVPVVPGSDDGLR